MSITSPRMIMGWGCDMWIFLALLIVPLIEIALFIQVGGIIGLGWTLLTVVLTAVAGTILLRMQGVDTLRRLQETVNKGGDPRGPLAHGALILVAGIVLLTPGFFTDAIGFLLLMPPVRALVVREIGRRATFVMQAHVNRNSPPASEDTVDVSFTVNEEPPEEKGNSGWTKPH